MAEAGSREARAIASSGVVDLHGAKMTDAVARKTQERIELSMGKRCSGCGRRIGVGIQFTSIDVRDMEQPVMRLSACNRDDCSFAEEAMQGGTWMEMVEFVWLDEAGVDAPASTIVRRDRASAD